MKDDVGHIVATLQAINEGNHDTVCQAIRDAMPPMFFSTVRYEGVECTTDGTQFVELVTPLNGLDLLTMPTIIAIPFEGADVEIISGTFETCLENVGVVVATLGHPLSDLGLWVRLVCIRFDVSVLDSSKELKDAMNIAVQTVLELDKTGCWLVNAAIHHCAQQSKVAFQEVADEYVTWSDEDQTEFIQNTSVAMGFQIAK